MQTEGDEASQEDTTEFLQYVSGQKDSESGEKRTWNAFVKSDTDHLSSDNQMKVRFETDAWFSRKVFEN